MATTTTRRANSASNSRPRIIASTMSCTWNSSKHSRAASSAISSASGGMGSSISGLSRLMAWKSAMRILHEFMEMDALFAGHLGRFEKQIHAAWICRARPRRPDKGRSGGPATSSTCLRRSNLPTQPLGGRFGVGIVAAQFGPEILQLFGGAGLGGVGDDGAGGDAGAVFRHDAKGGGGGAGHVPRAVA